MKNIAIVLPAYNEEQTIVDTMKGFHAVLPDASLWVVDNNSADKTAALALETLSLLQCKGGVLSEQRPGKGNAVRRAFLEIDADLYLLADADMTYPPEQATMLIEPVLLGKADMAVGDRHSEGDYAAENKRALHGFGNRLVCGLVNWLFNAKLRDIMSGYRVLNRRFVKSYPILVEGFEIETDMTLHALDKRFRVVELPVKYRDRPEGSYSKLNTLRDGFKVINTISRILRYYQPLKFFGYCALLFALAGLITGIPVLQDWIRERYIHHIPLAILATGLEITAMLFAAIGLILDSITHQDRRHFERDFLLSNAE